MLNFLRILLSGRDNESWDIGRFVWCLVILVFIYLSVFRMEHFDPVLWSTGAAAILGAGAGALRLKHETEPTPTNHGGG